MRRALAKKPQDRFVSIQAFVLALARASQTEAPIDEDASQVTAPLQTLARLSAIAPIHRAVALPSQKNQTVQMPTRAHSPVTTQQARALTLQNQNRLRMLGRLRRSYSDLMSQSLQGVALLELGLAEKPDAVQNATNLLLHVSNRAVQHLPVGVSIAQVYDEAEHELLILGEPGAGKSTMLLDMAQKLLVRAEQDQTHPLPVILPLSSWAVKRPKLEDWIAEQLAEIYDVPHKLSLQWVGEDAILPLLDGLNEMEETARPACIAAINTYHRERLAKLVVCCRTTEYEAAASRHRLALQGATVVQPLLTVSFGPRTSSGNSAAGLWKRMVRFFQALQGPRALQVTVMTKLSYVLSYVLSVGLSHALNYKLSVELKYALDYRLSDGLSYALISLALGAQMGDIRLTHRIIFNCLRIDVF